MLNNSWYKKEKPVQGLTGMGGGAASNLVGGGADSYVEASGGIVSEYTDPTSGNIYRSHAFTSTGTFTIDTLSPKDANNTFDYFLVAGGGGGGGRHAGGGGAGGVRSGTGIPESSTGNIAVTIGLGGWAANWGNGTDGNGVGYSGQNSSIAFTSGTITANGGGGGAGPASPSAAYPGGSGGGGGYPSIPVGYGYNPATPSPQLDPALQPLHPYPITQGHNGGAGQNNPTYSGGGGGGAGTGGYQAPTSAGGNGGAGINNTLWIGSDIGYAGGGGGGSYLQPTGTAGKGGGPSPEYFGAASGGGGDGVAGAAKNNLGGGGGGSGGGSWPTNGKAGAGGSGVGVIRYQIGTTNTAKCSGGAISFYNGKTIHTYVNSGTFVMPGTFSGTLEWVLVGGGGAGSHGGGGAGGYVVGSTPYTAPDPKSFTVTIGEGGKGDIRDRNNSTLTATGSNTEFYPTPIGPMSPNGWAALRGGPGGNLGNEPVTTGYPGGSGGGGARYGGGKPGGSTTQAPTTTNTGNTINIGYAGGSGIDAPQYGGGGGGGAGGAGTSASNSAQPWSPTGGGGPGGLGIQLPATFRDPKSSVGAPGPGGTKWWVCGGGGGAIDFVSGSPGNMSGGGGGQTSPLKADSWAGGGWGATSPTVVGNGVDGTGGGGGGATVNPWNSVHAKSGDGGSGLVLLAYPT